MEALGCLIMSRIGWEGFLDEAPAQKTEGLQQPSEHPSHSVWGGEEAGYGENFSILGTDHWKRRQFKANLGG